MKLMFHSPAWEKSSAVFDTKEAVELVFFVLGFFAAFLDTFSDFGFFVVFLVGFLDFGFFAVILVDFLNFCFLTFFGHGVGEHFIMTSIAWLHPAWCPSLHWPKFFSLPLHYTFPLKIGYFALLSFGVHAPFE